MDEPDDARTRLALRRRLASAISRAPGTIVVLGTLLAAVCVAFTVERLEFQSSRNDLISANVPWNARFRDWLERFPGATDLMIVVASDAADEARRSQAKAFIQDLVPLLEADPEIESVEWGAPESEFTPKVARLLPMEVFGEILAEAEQSESLLMADTPGDLLKQINDGIRKTRELAGGEQDPVAIGRYVGRLTQILAAIRDGLAEPERADSIFARLLDDPTAEPWLFLESPNGRLMFVMASPRAQAGTIDAYEAAIASTRRILESTLARHPEVEAGLTGTEVIDSDETRQATRDSSRAALASLLLIALLLVSAFQSFRMPLLLVLALMIGVGWSLGYLILAVGHLQFLSVMFLAVLFGLGVDFGIHLDATYEQVRRDHPDGPEHFEPALAETLRLSAPGIVTGALTTAAAFLTTAFSDFRGVAELGIIAAGGVVLCLIAMFSVFPALLRLFRHSHRHIQTDADRKFSFFREHWLLPVSRRPGVVLALAAAVSIVAGAAATRLEFVYDLLALQPEGVESVEWGQRIVDDGDVSVFFGVSVADDLEEAFLGQERFRGLERVASVGGVGILNPPDASTKSELIRAARARLETALAHGRSSPPPREALDSTAQLTAQLKMLRRIVAGALKRKDVPTPIAAELEDLQTVLDETRALLGELAGPPVLWRIERAVRLDRLLKRDVPERVRRVAQIDSAFVRLRQSLAQRLDVLLDPAPLRPEDFPPALMRPFVDASDPDHPRYALHIFPRLPDDPNVSDPLSPDFLPDFVADLESIDPLVTGGAPQIHRSGKLIWAAYQQAGVAALALVVVLVWVVFRSIRDALLALLPVLLSFLITFGVMGAIGVDLNPANLMVLPLLFGIGVDAGVHVVHRARMNPEERPIGLSFGTGKGITVTSVTTLCGFVTMIFASHRGVASLGLVMTIGLATTMVACWTVLPALLEILQSRSEGPTA